MSSDMTALGFSVSCEQDFRHYVYQASEFGFKIETPRGSYTLWQPGEGIELWVQTNLHHRIIGMQTHFSGQSCLPMMLTECVIRPGHSILDGAFYGWTAKIASDQPLEKINDIERFSLTFDAPDYDTYTHLALPHYTFVQLAAFAYNIKSFVATENAIRSYQMDQEFLKPLQTSSSMRKKQVAPFLSSQVTISGTIISIYQKVNPVTTQRFYAILLQTIIGLIDVVADPQVIQGSLCCGSMLSVTCRLSGRLLSL